MKKAAKLLLVLCMAFAMIFTAACSNGGSVAGEYKMVVDTTSMDESTAAFTNSLLSTYSLSLTADGKASMSVMGVKTEGTWKDNGDTVSITMKDTTSSNSKESTETFKKDGNRLISSSNKEMVFEKK